MSAALEQRRLPTTIEEFDACLRDTFIVLDGPPLAWVQLGEERHRYLLFGLAAEAASNSKLIAALWKEMSQHFPPEKTVLFWRRRPEIRDFESDSLGAAGPTNEEVQDGAEILPGYVFDFDSGRYRELLSRRLVRAISCRVWWPGLEKGNRVDGEAFPMMTEASQ